MNGEAETTSWSWCGHLTARDRSNQRRFVFWLAGWMLSFLAVTFLLKFDWVSGPLGYAVALAPNLLGLAAVRAFLRFLRQADELQRKIQVEALGWGFGSGAIFMIGYQLLQRAGLPKLDVADPLAVTMGCWALATLALARRYS